MGKCPGGSQKRPRSASTTTPQASTSGSSSSNFAQATTQSSQLALKADILKWMDADSSHILPCWDLITKRRKSLELADNSVLAAAERVVGCCINKWTDETKIRILSGSSKLSEKDLLGMLKADPPILDDLCHNALQIPPKFALPSEMSFLMVHTKFLTARRAKLGNRFHERSADDLHANGTIKKTVWCVYDLNWSEEDVLVRIVHRATGDSVVVDAAYMLSRKYETINIHDDFQCALEMKPLPPVRLCEFFKATETGPWKVHSIREKRGKIDAEVKLVFGAWEKQARETMTDSTERADTLAAEIAQHHKDERAKAMTAARDKAKTKLAERQLRKATSNT